MPKKLKILIFILSLIFLFHFLLESKFNLHGGADDAWFAEPAYTLVHHGYLAMPSWKGFLNYNFDKYVYWMMPLSFLPQALIYKVFGFGLFQVKLSAFLISVGLIIVTYFFAKDIFNANVAWMSLLLLLCNIDFIVVSITNRPDILTGLFTTISFFLLWKFVKTKRVFFLYFSVFSSSLALLSHGVGLVSAVAIYSYLLFHYRKNVKKFFILAIKSISFFIIPLIPYLLYVSLSIDSFILQFKWNAMGGKLFVEGLVAEITTRYPILIIYLPFYSLAFALSFFFYFKRRDGKNNFYLTITLSWLLLLALLIGNHSTLRYLVCIFPLASIFMANMFITNFQKKKYLLLLCLILFFHLILIGSFIATRLPSPTNLGFHQIEVELAAVGSESVVAPQFYFMYFQENLRSLTGITNLRHLKNESIGKIIEEAKAPYIIVDEDFKRNIENVPAHYQVELKEYLENKYEMIDHIESKRIELRNILKPFGFKCILKEKDLNCLLENHDIYLYRRVEF